MRILLLAAGRTFGVPIEGRASATIAERKSSMTLVVAVTQDGVTSRPSAGENTARARA